jgi:hypothetical protein
MPDDLHNQAYYILQDAELYGWPFVACLTRLMFYPFIISLDESWKTIVLVMSICATMCGTFFLLLDGAAIWELGMSHPAWGSILFSVAVAGVSSAVLTWLTAQKVDQQLSRGVLDASVDTLQLRDTKPRVLALASIVFLIIDSIWLVVLSKLPVS